MHTPSWADYKNDIFSFILFLSLQYKDTKHAPTQNSIQWKHKMTPHLRRWPPACISPDWCANAVLAPAWQLLLLLCCCCSILQRMDVVYYVLHNIQCVGELITSRHWEDSNLALLYKSGVRTHKVAWPGNEQALTWRACPDNTPPPALLTIPPLDPWDERGGKADALKQGPLPVLHGFRK